MADKLRKLLFGLETAVTLEQLGRFPGWKLHPLKGDLKGLWSVTVTGNWRLIFQYDERTNTASDLDPVLSKIIASPVRRHCRERL
jgi:proteic killer suppression protein